MKTLFRMMAASAMLLGGASAFAQDDTEAPEAPTREEIREQLKDLKEQRREAIRERRAQREAEEEEGTGEEG